MLKSLYTTPPNICDRTLLKLLSDTQDPLVLAVSVHDVGQYVKHYERGKKCVQIYIASAVLMSHAGW